MNRRWRGEWKRRKRRKRKKKRKRRKKRKEEEFSVLLTRSFGLTCPCDGSVSRSLLCSATAILAKLCRRRVSNYRPARLNRHASLPFRARCRFANDSSPPALFSPTTTPRHTYSFHFQPSYHS